MRTLKLEVMEAIPRDVNKHRVRVSKKTLNYLKMKDGDPLLIIGHTKTVAYALTSDESLDGKIRLDSSQRLNANISIPGYVKIRKTTLKEATSVEIEIISKNNFSKFSSISIEPYIKNTLKDIPILKGNTLNIYVMGLPLEVYILNTKPTGSVKVGINTKIIFTKQNIKEKTHLLTYEEIGGLNQQLQTLREMTEVPLNNPNLFKSMGIEPPRGILLYGPPGCGKTLIAKALASESKAHFLSINGPEIMSKYYGETEAKLRAIFKEAKKLAPSIIFIDEIDSIAPRRDDISGEVEVRLVAQLLALMDGLSDRGDVVVVGATNRIEEVDLALRRPGRFDREVEIGVPNEDGRYEILKIHTKGMPLSEDVDLKKYANITNGYTGADISALCREAAFIALKRILPHINNEIKIPKLNAKKLKISDEDFAQAYKQIVPTALREFYIEIPKVGWNDIAGMDDIIDTLNDNVVKPTHDPKPFKSMGIEPPRGILLYGPPGCGKTLIAKALASESKANLIMVGGSEILSKWVGESEKAIREIFRKAKSSSPSIILFDEIDAIAKYRGDEEKHTESILSQLITSIDSLYKQEMVFILGTTNRPDLIDPSLLRPGRFDLPLYIHPPDVKQRHEILTLITKNAPLDTDVKLDQIAEITNGFSGADLKSLLREAGLMAIKNNSVKIRDIDFKIALGKITPSISTALIKWYEDINIKLKSVLNTRTRPQYG